MLKRILQNVILVMVSLVVGLVLIELGLRLLHSSGYEGEYEFLVLEPGSVTTSSLPDAGLPGVEGKYTARVNSRGFRGDETSAEDFYRIITMGGSTTECVGLNQDETWPWLLQEDLTKRTGKRVWVGNVGQSGHQTRDHIYQVKYLLPQFKKTNAVIFLIGINDFLLRLERDSNYDPDYLANSINEQRQVRRAFWLVPDHFMPFLERLKLYQLLIKLKWRLLHKDEDVFDPVLQYEQWLRYRAEAKKIDRLPDLQSSLAEYERNLKRMIKYLKRYRVRPIFVTQPTLWREDLGLKEKKLLWLGYRGQRGSKEYYSVSALRKGMDLYNQKLMNVCKDEEVECIDLDAMLPRDTRVFFDACHFNEAGSRRVAELLCDYLASRPPFRQRRQ